MLVGSIAEGGDVRGHPETHLTADAILSLFMGRCLEDLGHEDRETNEVWLEELNAALTRKDVSDR